MTRSSNFYRKGANLPHVQLVKDFFTAACTRSRQDQRVERSIQPIDWLKWVDTSESGTWPKSTFASSRTSESSGLDMMSSRRDLGCRDGVSWEGLNWTEREF